MTEGIRFILNGEMREVFEASPATTLLQYLRNQEHLTGTKEGCAEGDCGACTVVVADYDAKNMLRVRAVNACITFLCALDGCEIITVEHMKRAGELHPAQKALVDCHGSQCGFCTPGFVMSLGALAHNKDFITDEDVQEALAGNLCRCTGYRPIVAAAQKLAKSKDRKLSFDAQKLQSIQRNKMLTYEADGRKFIIPLSVPELAESLAQNPNAVLLAGGTDIGLWVTKRHWRPECIIYTKKVAELQKIKKSAAGLEIGAAVSYAEAYAQLAEYDESLKELLQRIGSQQIRNSGTVGGNIANASPIGDGMPPLIALNARVVLASRAGTRILPLEDYFIAYGRQDRKDGEFIEKILIPPRDKNTRFRVYKLSKRFDQDISAVCAAFAFRMDGDVIKEARIAFGGMAATPKRALAAETALNGKNWTEKAAQMAMEALEGEFKPLTDMRAGASYRLQAAKNLLYRFYLETSERETQTRVYGYGNG